MKKRKVKVLRNLNKWILVLTIIFAFGGAFFILDASSISATLTYGKSSPYFFFSRQLIFVIASFIIAIIILKIIDTKAYEPLSGIASLVILGITGIKVFSNVITGGISTLTINIAGIQLQPAEFLKLFLTIYVGSFLGKWSNCGKPKWLIIFPLSMCLFSVILVVAGGDLGSAAIMLALFALIIVSTPIRKDIINSENKSDIILKKAMTSLKYIAVIGLFGSVALLKFGYKIIPEELLNQSQRLSRLIYTNPCDRYEEQTGYQVCNGYIAIDNGGLFGVGAGKSVQKYLYLPESHTDFIFPIIVEEFGVITGVIIILLYMFLTYLIFKVATNTYDLSKSIICYGIGIYFMLHIFVNLGGVLGIIPLTGVPLPFLSYGGSSCLAIIGAFTVIQRIYIENQIEKKNREINKIVNK